MNGRCYIPTFGILLTCMKSQKARFTGSYCKVNYATQKDIQDALIQPPEDGPLELIILRVKIRPDG
jgi:hypothetical protein